VSFSAALVIPIYNHGGAIAATVERLLPYELPILIVDDGSDPPTQEALTNLLRRHPGVRLWRLEHNRGKGAAVMRGLREAHALGFSHALQIDADGQHDATAVPRFINAAQHFPEGVISGVPQYDSTVPRSRLYGRYFTHFWVWIETLSFAIGDSMCGCRVYPLAATIALLERTRLRERMDFDTEVIVRLVWRGVPVRNLPLAVTYPEGGLSHFDLWRDNLRISWLHTCLFFGMLPRLPLLLWRKLKSAPLGPSPQQLVEAAPAARATAPPDSATSVAVAAHLAAPAPRHWAQLAERGAAWGLDTVYGVYRLLGPRGAKLLLLPVVAYFFLTGGAARRASLDYLRRFHRHCGATPDLPRPPGRRDALRHFYRFAGAALDKVLAWRGDDLQHRVRFDDLAALDAVLRENRGALVIGAHLGNLEMCRALAAHAGHRTINAVVHTAHAARFAGVLARSNPRASFKLLQVADFGPDTAVLLREKIDAGEWLVIVADRTPVAENRRVVQATFLGAPALFPQGPFILAHLLQCPVYLLACLREQGAADYRVAFELFAEGVFLPRQGRAQALGELAQAYAHWLERQCRRGPLEWFNFFDFWAPAAAGAIRGDPGAAPVTPGGATGRRGQQRRVGAALTKPADTNAADLNRRGATTLDIDQLGATAPDINQRSATAPLSLPHTHV
jgi:predicted LPLAT superfamily acyltransferase/GT2 family glycosyltransferase